MKKDFFEQLKNYLITNQKDKLSLLIPHYENLLQHKEDIKPFLNDLQEWNFDIYYEHDQSEGYTDGSFTIQLHKDVGELIEDSWGEYYEQEYATFQFEIDLLHDERYWSYCTCKPDHEGYIEKYRCCGDGCDWVAPSFNLKKLESLAHKSFKGEQYEMWKLEEKWVDHMKKQNEQKRLKELKYIEQQLMELEEKKNKLLGL
jgi:hypothetical protein